MTKGRSILPASDPLILRAPQWPDFSLLDLGRGEKLERYGDRTIIRPEAQALGERHLPDADWDAADSIFSGDSEDEGAGRWRHGRSLTETWPLAYGDVRFLGRFTAFRHVGFFAEQSAHWDFMRSEIVSGTKAAGRPLRVLNLFGYTGVASLIAAQAGAHVTHVDASKKAMGWARENQDLSKMQDLPVRWICDDARKFVDREARRGKTYDGILVDPPKFGRGPKGEIWNLFDDVPELVDACARILAPEARFMILTAYAIRASFMALDVLMRERLAAKGGSVSSGELLIGTETGDRSLSTSLFSRWSGP